MTNPFHRMLNPSSSGIVQAQVRMPTMDELNRRRDWIKGKRLGGGTLSTPSVVNPNFTWTNITANVPANISTFQRVCCDGTGQKVMLTTSGGDTNQGVMLSTNAGATWTFVQTGDFFGSASSTDGVDLVAQRRSPSLRMDVSTNSGSSWTLVTVAGMSHGADFLLSMSGDGTKIVAGDKVGGGSIYVSTDGGSTFTAKAAFGTATWLYGKYSRDGSTIYVSTGFGGSLLKSTDGGASATDVTPSGSGGGGDVCCSSDGSVVVFCGRDKNIYVSTNGGSTWTAASTTPDGDSFPTLFCSDSGAVVFYASDLSNTVIYVSNSTAKTWTTQVMTPPLPSSTWNDVTCAADGKTAYAVGGNTTNMLWKGVSS